MSPKASGSSSERPITSVSEGTLTVYSFPITRMWFAPRGRDTSAAELRDDARVRCAIRVDPPHTRPVEGSLAHRAGHRRGVQVAVGQVARSEPSRGVSYRHQLGVSGGIDQTDHLAAAFADDQALTDEDGAVRLVARRHRGVPKLARPRKERG